MKSFRYRGELFKVTSSNLLWRLLEMRWGERVRHTKAIRAAARCLQPPLTPGRGCLLSRLAQPWKGKINYCDGCLQAKKGYTLACSGVECSECMPLVQSSAHWQLTLVWIPACHPSLPWFLVHLLWNKGEINMPEKILTKKRKAILCECCIYSEMQCQCGNVPVTYNVVSVGKVKVHLVKNCTHVQFPVSSEETTVFYVTGFI